MKNYKSIVAVLLALVLVSTLIACTQKPKTENVTQVVTNENGEVVTGENGEAITEEIEAQVVTDANGKPVTEVVTDSEGKPLTTVQDGEYVNVTQNVTEPSGTQNSTGNTGQPGNKSGSDKGNTAKSKGNTTAKNGKTKTTVKPVKKPTAPQKPAKITAGSIKEDKLTLSWTKVKCSGYQVQYSTDGVNFSYLSKSLKSNSLTVDGLISYTKYTFRVRAFNKNSAGTSVSKWTKASFTTKAADDSRKITLTILLPSKGYEDTLTIIVDGKKYTETVNLDGSVYTFTTKEKFKGLVSVEAKLAQAGVGYKGKTDKKTIEIDLTGAGIYIIDGEDD